MGDTELERDFLALECVHRTRATFSRRIAEESASRDERVLANLRADKMFEFAEFYYTIRAMGLLDRGDALIIADLHNRRIEELLKDRAAIERRGLNEERLLSAIFTSDVLPRLDMIWNESPGALDQSNLARLLVLQMSSESVRSLSVAAEKAGLLNRFRHPTGAMVLRSVGVMERVLGDCVRQMRVEIGKL